MRSSPYWPALEAIAHTLAYEATIKGDRSMPAWLASTTMPSLVMERRPQPCLQAPGRPGRRSRTLPHAQYRSLEGRTHDLPAEVVAPVLAELFAS